jgi:hypothetical protein
VGALLCCGFLVFGVQVLSMEDYLRRKQEQQQQQQQQL